MSMYKCARRLFTALSVFGLAIGLGSEGRAAPITWTTQPTMITSVNDIDLTGVFVHAGTWGSGSVDVTVGAETITFGDRPINSTDGFAGVTANGEYSNAAVFAEPAGFDANFGTVLDSFAYGGTQPKPVTIEGLTPGTEYQIQLFVSDDRGCCAGRTQKWSDSSTGGAGNETGAFNHGDSVYVIGRFTADAASQMIYGLGVGQPETIVNGYVLRLAQLWDAVYTWDGTASGDWGSAHWIKDPSAYPPVFPLDNGTDQRVKAVVDTPGADVLVEADHTATDLDLLQGTVTIGGGNSLTVTRKLSGDGTIVLGAGSRLSTGAGGSVGTIRFAGTAGSPSVVDFASGTTTVTTLSDGGTAGAMFVKQGDGTLAAGTVGALSSTAFRIEGGTLAVNMPGPLGSSTQPVQLAGGELRLQGQKDPARPPLPALGGLQLYLDGSDISADGSAFTDGAVVAGWKDKSGNGFDAAASGDPTYKAAGLGGEGVVHFDGNDGFTLGDLSAAFPTEATLFVVSTIDNDPNYNFFTTRSNDTWWRYHGNGLAYPGVFRGSRINNYSPMPTSGSHVFEVVSNAGGWEMFEDGQSHGLAGANYASGNDYRIGMHDNGNADKYLRGDIAEILVYNTTLTQTQRDSVRYHLQQKYDMGPVWPIQMPDTDFVVSGDSTLNAVTDSSAEFGKLTLENGILTTKGAPAGITFTKNTEIAATATAVGFDPQVETHYGTITRLGGVPGPPLTISKAGPGKLTLNQANVNLSSATWDAAGGTLTMVGTAPFGGSQAMKLSGGTFEVTDLPGTTPVDVTGLAGLVLHLDAGDINGDGLPDTLNDGDTVATWVDTAGAADNATAPAPVANQPKYHPNRLGGQPALEFDTDERMTTLTSFGNPYTIFTISQMENTANFRLISSASGNWLLGYWGGSKDRMYAGGWVNGTGSAADANPHIYGATDTGTNTRLYGDGVDLTLDSNPDLQVGRLQLNGWNGGSSEASNGDVAEVLIFDRVLNDIELNQVGYYLEDKYGLDTPYVGSIPSFDYDAYTVEVTGDSTLKATTDGYAHFGALTLAGGTLTTAGAPDGIRFASITVNAPDGAETGLNPQTATTFVNDTLVLKSGIFKTAGRPQTFSGVSIEPTAPGVTVGLDPQVATTYTLIDGKSADVVFSKAGSGLLTLGTGGTPTAGLGNATLDAHGGVLRLIGAAAWAGATEVQLSGGTIQIADAPIPINQPETVEAYYSFDHTAGNTVFNDGSLADRDGNLMDGAALTTGGQGAKGEGMLIADDSNQRLEVPGDIDLGPQWTISAWFNTLHPVGQWRTLTRGRTNDHQIIVQDNSNNLGVYQSSGAGGGFRDSGADLVPDPTQWHHIVSVGSGNTTDLYVDGVLVGTSDRKSETEVTWIGNHSAGQPFAERIDEVMIYDRALSAAEVQDLFNVSLNPLPVLPALSMTDKNFTVTGDSTLYAGSSTTADFGTLTLEGGTLKITGAPGGVSFTSTTINATGELEAGIDAATATTFNRSGNPVLFKAGTLKTVGTPITFAHGISLEPDLPGPGDPTPTLGFDPVVETHYTDIKGNSRTLIVSKTGLGKMTLEPGETSAMENATFDAHGGVLEMVSAGAWAGSTKMLLSGGTLLVGEPSTGTAPGLDFGALPGSFNRTDANPATSTTTDLAATEGAIPGNTTHVYTGQFFDADGSVSFQESIDDNAQLLIDGTRLALSNGRWNVATTSGDLALAPGWHDFELRLGNGGGPGGKSTQTPVGMFGFGFDPDGGNLWIHPEDPGDGSLFRRVLYATAVNLATHSVEVTADSVLRARTDSTASFGALTLQAGTLTTAGAAGGMSFASTTVPETAETVGINSQTDTSPGPLVIHAGTLQTFGRPIAFDSTTIPNSATAVAFDPQTGTDLGPITGELDAGNGPAATIAKVGSGTLMLERPGTNLEHATFEAHGGNLTMVGTAPWGGSQQAVLSGGTLVVAGQLLGGGAAPANPQAYYSFDDEFNPGNDDANPGDNAQDGRLLPTLDGATWAAGGAVGSAGSLALDGVDDFVSATVDVSETAYGVSLWFKTDADNGGLFSAVDVDLGGSNDRHIYLDQGGLASRVWQDESIATDGLGLADGQWHHVVHTFGGDQGGQKLYVDGILAASGDKAESDFDGQALINIGYSVDANPDFLSGQIDEVRVYDRALSGADAAAMVGRGALDRSSVDLTVTDDSTLAAAAAGTVNFHSLTMKGGILTTAGTPIAFAAGTTVAPDPDVTEVGFDPQTPTDLGPISAGGAAVNIVKVGSGELLLDEAPSGADNASFEARGGRLIGQPTAATSADPFGAAELRIGGGELALTANAAGAADFDNALAVAKSGTLSVGKAGVGPNGPQTVNLGSGPAGNNRGVSVAADATLTIAPADDYALNVAGALSGDGGVSISSGKVTLAGAGSSIGSLTVGGGQVSTAGNALAIGSKLALGDTRYEISDGGSLAVTGTDLAAGALLTVAGGTVSIAGPSGAPAGAVVHYSFDDGTADDGTGAGRDGALVGDAQVLGGALVLDGAGDYVQLPDLGAEFAGSATLTAWLKLNNATPTDGTRTGFFDFDNGANTHYTWTNGQMYCGLFRSGGRFDAITPDAGIDRAQWHMVTVVSDPAEGYKIYQNGTEIFSAAQPPFGIANWRIGTQNGAWLDGQVDTFTLFNRGLTAADVADLFAAGRELPLPPVQQPTTDVLVTADSAFFSRADSVVLGDLTIRNQPGPTRLVLSGGTYSFFDVTVDDGAIIAGSAAIRGTVAPGGSVGTMVVEGALTIDSGAVYEWELGSPAGDLIQVIGTLTLPTADDSWTIKLKDAGGSAAPQDELTLFTYDTAGWIGDLAADLNGDNVVDDADLNLLLSAFGQTGAGVPGDISGPGGTPDEVVDVFDVEALLGTFGDAIDHGDLTDSVVIDTSAVPQWLSTANDIRVRYESGRVFLTGVETPPAPLLGVPEPGALALFIIGVLGFVPVLRKRRRA